MSLFKKSCCYCSAESSNAEKSCTDKPTGTEIQTVKVLGAGCKSCHEMYENTRKALENAGIPVEAEYVTDMEKVMAYGIMSMPGLVVNEQVVSMGKVLKPTDIEELLRKFGS